MQNEIAKGHREIPKIRFWESRNAHFIRKNEHERFPKNVFWIFLGNFWGFEILFGKMQVFLGFYRAFQIFFGNFWERKVQMVKKNFKGRCQKKKMKKCREVVKTYSDIQTAYADDLEKQDDITEFCCNVVLDGLEYSSDFLCIRADGERMVRECVKRKYLTKPLTVKLLDMSRTYWMKRGITDWGIVIDEESDL